MVDTEKKELVIIPEKQIEPNQESITKTYNELTTIFKAVLFVAIIILTITLIYGIIRSSGL